MEQVLLEGDGDGGFTAGRETGEPEGEALLPAESRALIVGETVVPCDVAGGA